ncbi:MAG: helix-turn-helix domain-containing protein [Clostridium sp.]|nr:helix-turn-helix domain-containing protein [Clostridium sp.]
MDSSLQHVGEHLGFVRMISNKTEEDIAKALGITSEEYKELEKSPEIDDETLEKIANALGFPVEMLKGYGKKLGHNYLSLRGANHSNNYIGNMNVFIQSDKDMIGMFLGFIKEIVQGHAEFDKKNEEYFQQKIKKVDDK